jgi:beta-lactamase class A
MNVPALKKRAFIFLILFLTIFNVPVFADHAFKALEDVSGGRLGVSAINTANHAEIQYRPNERFPFCSTFKVMGVGALLKESMNNPDLLARRITYKKEDLVTYSPITEQHLQTGMTVAELCEATLTTSDNTAINLLMKILGGPDAVTAFAKSIENNSFRLTRWEPNLNMGIPKDTRDTTSPRAMRISLQKLVLGHALAEYQRKKLESWLQKNTTGNSRIRAGLPRAWLVGDKTGTGEYGTTNDVGIIYPPGCKPIVVTIYFTQRIKEDAPREDVIASATKILMHEFAKHDLCLKNALKSGYHKRISE